MRSRRPPIDTGAIPDASRQAKGLPLGLHAPVTRPPLSIASTGSWDIAISGQALGHMPRDEKLAFSDAFDAYKAFNQLRNEEDATWRRLELINHADMLGAGDWVALDRGVPGRDVDGRSERPARLRPRRLQPRC